ncbi:MAG: nucleotide exchange factor GrpE [Chloroflexota bacterium]|nr:nucleotide exchange factor GrpE [Chloroflexota bacterium]
MRKKNKKDTKDILNDDDHEGESPSMQQNQHPKESDAPAGETDSLDGGEASPDAKLSPEEISDLQSKLEESQAQADEYLDGWQRARAEFANYKKRIKRERERIYQNAAGDIVKQYLLVIDDLDRALKNRPDAGDGADWAEGIELIYRKTLSILEAEGITPMDAEGKIFDPNKHEAIAQTDSDEHESDQIIEVVQQGYTIGDRVLRPAMVRIAA